MVLGLGKQILRSRKQILESRFSELGSLPYLENFKRAYARAFSTRKKAFPT